MTCKEKVRFETRAEARKILKRLQATPRDRRILRGARPGYLAGSAPRSIYKCREEGCGGFHLTSQPE